MYKLDGSNVEMILTYENVFNDALPDIKAEIKTLNMHKSISIICELIGSRLSKTKSFNLLGRECFFPYETVIKSEILGIAPKSAEECRSNPILHKNKHIITIQMLLMLLKFILAYGNRETLSKTDYSITKDDYKKIIQLQLAVASEFDKTASCTDFDKNHFVYANYHLNVDRNVGNAFLRMYYMFEMLSKNKDLFDDDVKKEYRDYYNDFSEKYSITPTQYLCYLFSELQIYFEENKLLLYKSIWRNVNQLYDKINDKSIVSKIIDILSFKIDDTSINWAKNTIKNYWDFSFFFSHPYIQIEDLYISISDVTLKNAFFEKMFWLVRECYLKDDSRAMSFFGRLFERYIQTISEKAISSSYEYINEFEWGSKNVIKSSDAYIKSGENLLVIEAKGFSVLQNCMIRNTSVEENNKKLFVKPILQADTFLSETISEFDKFRNVKEAYIVSVTMDSINAVPDYYTSIIDEIEKKKRCPKSKYFFNLSIEEYEMLLYVIEAGEDCFSLLKDYYSQKALSPFSGFLMARYPQVKMTNFMKEIYDKATATMGNTLFGNYKTAAPEGTSDDSQI